VSDCGFQTSPAKKTVWCFVTSVIAHRIKRRDGARRHSFERAAGPRSTWRPVLARRSEIDLFGNRQGIVNL